MSDKCEPLFARRYFASGTVQGVGYRYFVQRAAQRLRLSGFVRNLRDGRVEVFGCGDHASLRKLRAELERGPRGATVTGVEELEVSPGEIIGGEFRIEYDR